MQNDLATWRSDTLGHIAEACAKGEADNGRKGPLNLPNLTRLGLVKAHEGSTGKIAAGMDGNAGSGGRLCLGARAFFR